MRHAFIVSYDVSDPRRLRKVFVTLRGYGDHLQLSVFRCELDRRELVELRAKLSDIVHHGDDQVLFVDVGPVDGRASTALSTLGRGYSHPERYAVIV